MHRREAYIEAQVCQYAERRGWRQRKVAFVGRKGCPDRWFFRAPGRVVIIEFKDPNGPTAYHQKKEIAWFRENGFHVHKVDSIEQGCAIFDAFGPAEDGDPDEDS